MIGIRKFASAILLSAAIALPAQAQLVSDGGATFEIVNFGLPTSTWGVDLETPTGIVNDQLFAMDFLFRFSGDAGQTRIGTPDTSSTAGNTITLGWNDIGGKGRFGASMTIELVGLNGGNDATLTIRLALSNLQGTPSATEVFWFADVDAATSTGGDFAALANPNDRISIAQSGEVVEVFGRGADAYEVRNVTDGLEDAMESTTVAYDANNSGLPFGPTPGQYTGLLQWVGNPVPAEGTLVFDMGIGVNVPAVPVELSEYEID